MSPLFLQLAVFFTEWTSVLFCFLFTKINHRPSTLISLCLVQQLAGIFSTPIGVKIMFVRAAAPVS